MSFFPEAITYIIGKTLQKENQVKQNIVPLRRSSFPAKAAHFFPASTTFIDTERTKSHHT